MSRRPGFALELAVALLLALLLGAANFVFAAGPVVYECITDGQRTYSDRPCGTDARPRRVEAAPAPVTAAAPTPGAPPRASESRSQARPPAQSRNPTPAARASTHCHDLQAQVDRIDARMRLGYRNKAGETLKDRRRALTEEYAARRCNTTVRRAGAVPLPP